VLVEQRVVDPDHLAQGVAAADAVVGAVKPGPRRRYAHVTRQPNVALLAVEPPMTVEGFEVVGQRADVLARSEQHHALTLQREVKQTQNLLLSDRLQVDQQVAAADQVDARERRVLDHVVRGEH
jgi:hypothetical protein